jgi:hypothetical protein
VIAVDGDQLVVRFPQLDIAFVVLRSVDSEAPERFFPEAKVEADSRLQEHYELDGDVHTEYPRATVTLSRARMPRGSCYSDFHDWFLFAMPEIERTCGFLVSVLEGDADTPIDIIEITGAPAEERKGLIRLAIERLFEQWQVDYKRAVRSGRILGPSPWARGA